MSANLEEMYRFQELIAKLTQEKQQLQNLVTQQGQLVTMLEKEVEKLRRENEALRRMVRKDLAEQTVRFREIESKLDALEAPILTLILENTKKLGRSLSYEDILRFARNSPHPALRVAKTETICRRVRKLAEKIRPGGPLLISVERGTFYPNITETEKDE